MTHSRTRTTVLAVTRIALMCALIIICSWYPIPFVVPFTLQTFAIYAALLILGGGEGTAAVLLYLVLGAIGLPVFSGFGGGIGHLLGPTGGYIFGFIFLALLYWAMTANRRTGLFRRILALVLGTLVVYAVGTLWFWLISARPSGRGLMYVLSICVFPFVLIDALKMGIAVLIARRLPFSRSYRAGSQRGEPRG